MPAPRLAWSPPAATSATPAPGEDDDEETGAATGEAEESLGSGLWLTKAGEGRGRARRRWFVLQRGAVSRTLRLTYFTAADGERKGCIDVTSAASVGLDGALITIVSCFLSVSLSLSLSLSLSFSVSS